MTESSSFDGHVEHHVLVDVTEDLFLEVDGHHLKIFLVDDSAVKHFSLFFFFFSGNSDFDLERSSRQERQSQTLDNNLSVNKKAYLVL